MFFCFFAFSNLRKVHGFRSSLGGPNYGRYRGEATFFFYTTACCIIGSAKRRPKSTYLPQVWKREKTDKHQKMQLTRESGRAVPKSGTKKWIRRRYGEIRRRPTSVRAIFTSVACGPDSPRPKDCPGLGDPNTLKIRALHWIKFSKKSKIKLKKVKKN